MFQPMTECVDSLTIDDVTGQAVPESDMRAASFKHSLLSVDVDVGMWLRMWLYVRIFESNILEAKGGTGSWFVSYHIIGLYHIVDLKQQNRLKVGTDKPKLKVKMQSVSGDDVRKRLLEKPRFELTAKGVFRLGRC